MKHHTTALLVVAALLLGALFWFTSATRDRAPSNKPETNTPVTDSIQSDEIRVTTPAANTFVTSPLTITGEVRGTWFFEGSFPVGIEDANGKEIARGFATSTADWMTSNFVPFSSTLVFGTPETSIGMLMLANDNPSGLPEFDKSIKIPVRFAAFAPTDQVSGGCRITGCSNHLCADTDMVTTCEFRPEYACYVTAKCGRLTNGACGWQQTPELTKCLANALVNP